MAPLPQEIETKYTVSCLNRLVPLALDYSERKKLARPWWQYLNHEVNLRPDLSTDWHAQAQDSLSLLALFGSVSNAAAFVRGVGSQLPDEELSLVKLWRGLSWMTAAYRVKAVLESNFVQISLLGTPPPHWPSSEPWGTVTLYSPNLYSRALSSDVLMVSILWKGPQAWHTFGPMIDLPGFEEADLLYLTALAEKAGNSKPLPLLMGVKQGSRSLTAELGRHAGLSQLLFYWSSRPVVATPVGVSRFHLAVMETGSEPQFMDQTWWEKWTKKHKESVGSFELRDEGSEVYLGEGSAMRDPWLLYSTSQGVLFLGAFSANAYQRGQKCLAGSVDFPILPPVCVSPLTTMIATDLFPKLKDYYSQLTEAFRHEPDESQEVMSTIMDRLVENHNEGIVETAEQTASALGVDLDQVLNLEATLQKTFSKFPSPDSSGLDIPPRVLHDLSKPGIPHSPGVFGVHSLAPESELLEKTIVLKLLRWFTDVMIHNNGRIPATASGYLGTTVVEDAWQRFQKDDPLNQWVGFPRQERQWRWLHVHRAFFEGAHFLAVDKKGFFVATPALQRLEDPWALYGDLLQTLLLRGGLFHHSNLADTLQKVLSHCGGTLLYVLAKESQKQAKSDGWLTAGQLAPVVTSSLPVDAHQAETLVDLLMARGPFESFGLIEPHTQERVDFTKPTRFRPTNLFWKVFELGT